MGLGPHCNSASITRIIIYKAIPFARKYFRNCFGPLILAQRSYKHRLENGLFFIWSPFVFSTEKFFSRRDIAQWNFIYLFILSFSFLINEKSWLFFVKFQNGGCFNFVITNTALNLSTYGLLSKMLSILL